METTRVKYGTTERIFVNAFNASGTPLTGLSDVKLEIYRKSDGKYFDFDDETFKSAGWTTRQGVMTELSSTYSPGVYYYDFDTTDHTSQFVEECFLMTMTSVTAANDPVYGELKVGGYVDQIGISSGVIQYGKGKGMTMGQIEEFAKKVWQVVLSNGKTAADTLLSKSEFNALTDKVLVDFPEVKFPEIADRTDEVIKAIQDNKVVPKDYTKSLKDIMGRIEKFEEINLFSLKETVKEFEAKMSVATDQINGSLETVADVKAGFDELKTAIDEFKEKVSETTDMDRRFENMTSVMQKQQLEELVRKMDAMMKKILTQVVTNKYDILKELK